MPLLYADKKSYKPDLNELLTVCELNYYLLLKLWPCLNDAIKDKLTKSWVGDLKLKQMTSQTETISLKLSITDVARYTTTMNLMITSPKLKFSNEFNLIIRMYHDLRLLEVMEGSGPATLKAIYHNSEINLKPADEKRQINRFLGECLRAVSS